MKGWNFGLVGGMVAALWLGGGGLSLAQITPDNTLGTRVNGSLTAPCTGTCYVTNGTSRGSNLFHSFQQFSLPNPTDHVGFVITPVTQNVIVRVTGIGQPFISNINGMIATITPAGTLASANFFLLNPNGILFGPDANLQIGGSFLATTANRMVFQDGTIFDTRDSSPLLTISVPAGLQMGQPVADIQVDRAYLMPPSGTTLALVGGNVTFSSAFLYVPEGRIEVGSVAEAGLVKLKQIPQGWILDYAGIQKFGDIQLSDTWIRGSGNPSSDIQIQAQNLTLSNDSRIFTQSSGQDGGQIVIGARGTLEAGENSFISTANLANGRAGDISLQVGTLNLRDHAKIVANSNSGTAGNLTIRATEAVNLFKGSQLSAVSMFGNAGGNLFIETGSLHLVGDAVVDTGSPTGRSGNITIRARDSVTLTEAATLASFSFFGIGGDIDIEARNLQLLGGSQLFTSTFGDQPAGSVRVRALDSIQIVGMSEGIIPKSSGIFTQVKGQGNAGSITLITNQLSILDRGKVSASNILGSRGRGGDIDIQANVIEVIGASDTFYRSAIETHADGTGQAGRLRIQSGRLTVQDGGRISASTYGNAPGGTIAITSDRVEVIGQSPAGTLSEITVETSGFGNQPAGNVQINAQQVFLSQKGRISAIGWQQGGAGDIEITAQLLQITNGASVVASTFGQGNAGSIQLHVNSLDASSGGNVQTNTSSSGKAGNIVINARDSLSLTDPGTGIFSSTTAQSTGDGGSIVIDPRTVTVQNGAAISVSSLGSGQGGDITIQADRLTLSNTASIKAETASTQGGDITLNVRDILLMRNNSLISTTAGTAQAGGDGGNIDIDAGFIVAVRQENSDITANAFTGRGGNIQIDTQGLFGIQFRPQLTPESDITASSQFGLNGSVIINLPNVDPSRGLVALPVDLSDPTRLIVEKCGLATLRSPSSFTFVGRGGLPPDPTEMLDQETLATSGVNRSRSAAPPTVEPAPVKRIVRATGWRREANGNIRLIAEDPSPLQLPWLPTVGCRETR
jgi:filamentous hemagglutinin family protein